MKRHLSKQIKNRTYFILVKYLGVFLVLIILSLMLGVYVAKSTSNNTPVYSPMPTVDPEPYTNCNWGKGPKGNLSCPDKRMKKSECLDSVCCELKYGKSASMSKSECAKIQAVVVVQKPVSDIVTCTFDSRCNRAPAQMPKSVCQKIVCCNLALDYWVTAMTTAECKQFQQKAMDIYNSIYKNSPPLSLSQYVPAITQYTVTSPNVPTIQQIQQNQNVDYSSICNTQYQADIQKANSYGGSSGDAIRNIAKTNLTNCLRSGNTQNINVQPNVSAPTPTVVGIWYGNLGPL